MIPRLAMGLLALTAAVLPSAALAEPISFKMLSNQSRATFKTDAPLETIVGNTAGPAVTGSLTVDLTTIKLTPEQVEAQKRFGFTSDNLKVRAKFGTTFSNHGIAIPQLLFLKLANEIQFETDLTFVRQ